MSTMGSVKFEICHKKRAKDVRRNPDSGVVFLGMKKLS
jgi:hypothetical protein